jgi:glycosyltransferase involved in cell wall biosynthesis
MNSTIALFTVVYPGCEPYLNRFFQSVREQDSEDFHLMVLNDGVTDLNRYTEGLENRVEEIFVKGSIADVRRKGIQLLMESDFEKVIFADSDDTISTDRVRLSAQALESYDIVVNDLTTVTDCDKTLIDHYLTNRVDNHFIIGSDFIVDKNFIGLGNTAVRCSQLRDLPIPSDTIAVDWMIFTDMLLRGASAIFKSDPLCYYRQHQANTAGFKHISEKKIRHGLTVQIQNTLFFAEQNENHQLRLKKLLQLRDFLSENSHNIKTYKKAVEENLPEFPLWWEEIYTLDQLSL